MKKMIFANTSMEIMAPASAQTRSENFLRLIFSSLALTLFTALVLVTTTNRAFAGQHTNIAELRAAYYFNALKFTHWPEERLNERETLNIVLVGNDPVSSILANKLPDYLIKGRKLSITSLTQQQVSEQSSEPLLDQAHAIYFASNTRENYPQILQKLKQPVLTGSSIEDFANHGGMVEIAFEPKQQKLNFHINTHNLKQSSISISSTLMKISTIVDSNTNNGTANNQ